MTTPADQQTSASAPKRRRKLILTSVLLSAVAIGGVIAACSTQSGPTRKHSVGAGGGGAGEETATADSSVYDYARQSESMRRERDASGMAMRVSPGAPPPPAASAQERMPADSESSVSLVSPQIEGRGGGRPIAQPTAPSFVSAPGEELWIITRTPRDPGVAQTRPRMLSSNDPGSGCLVAIVPGQTQHVPVPLEHTEVGADIRGYIGAVGVHQRFYNPFDTKIEAVYVFPLPQNSAINEFLMTVGDRTIRGIIRERKEAEEIYANARAQGHVASLMTQQRPNIFTQKVANIEPGKTIDIDITYFQTLRYDNNAWEFTFPMVVGPRFNPPGSTDGIGAVTMGAQPGAAGQNTQISYLAPDQRSGHDIGLTINIDAGMPVGRIT